MVVGDFPALGGKVVVSNQTFFAFTPIWMFPKIVGFPPKSSIFIGFSIIFTIHFGVPLSLETPHMGKTPNLTI